MTEIDVRERVKPDFELASNQRIVDFFKQEAYLKELYESDSGVWQDYTLEQHTLMMMGQFDRYFADDFSSPLVSLGQFKVMLALHDIGKPAGVKEKGKEEGRRHQHEYTAKIIPEALGDLGFDPSINYLLTAVPTQDIMGKYLRRYSDEEIKKGKKALTLEEAEAKFREAAEGLGVNPRDLLDLVYIYYMSDAGSYTKDADPDIGVPPPGHESLDHLFVFSRNSGEEKGKMELVPELNTRINVLRDRLSNS